MESDIHLAHPRETQKPNRNTSRVVIECPRPPAGSIRKNAYIVGGNVKPAHLEPLRPSYQTTVRCLPFFWPSKPLDKYTARVATNSAKSPTTPAFAPLLSSTVRVIVARHEKNSLTVLAHGGIKTVTIVCNLAHAQLHHRRIRTNQNRASSPVVVTC